MASSDVEGTALVVRALLEEKLDEVSVLALHLSEDDSAYGLVYIGEKLTLCSAYLEQIGDVSMSVSKIALEIAKQLSSKRSLLALKEREFKSEPVYVGGDRNDRVVWLQKKLQVFRIELEEWELTHLYLSEIRGAINDRIQLFKRLDSDIRLQHKLLESKVLAGVMPPDGTRGKGSTSGIEELEID